ncbi:MAG: anaerobic ribonucleoside-triphosphate reductase activating protein [Bacilli bacterium]
MNFVGIDKLSLVDYDEYVSCILFSKGCNFKCPFCHNASLVVENPNIEIPFEDILDYLKTRIGVIDAVVVSGGEPTLMKDLEEKITAIKNLGFLIKLDTNGTNPKMLKDLVNKGLINYVAMDIKNSKECYPLTCGLDKINMDPICESIEFLLSNKVPYEFRTTLVNEFHTPESIKQLGELITGADKLFLQHFKDGGTCIQSGLHEVVQKDAEKYLEILSKYVNTAELRGY